MSGFSADWLALREGVDGAARNRELVARLPGSFSAIVDLGAGTGANLRWLAPRLGAGQRWYLIDKDEALLARARTAIRVWAEARGLAVRESGGAFGVSGPDFDCSIRTRALDLDGDLRALDLPDGCLVTASALLDLVSRDWLARLVARAVASSAAVFAALSFDGGIAIDPPAAGDDRIVALVHRHQRTDKGFGRALGPDAWRVAGELLAAAGYSVHTADTPWQCGAADAALLEALIAGWSEAALAMAPAERQAIEAWRASRLADAATGALEVAVGHRDLVALAPARRPA